MRVDVQALDCDFYVFSGHKMFAPTGIGVVYGKQEVLDAMPPWQGGGNMIEDVTFERTDLPDAAAALRGRHRQHRRRGGARAPRSTTSSASASRTSPRYEHELLVYATRLLRAVPGLQIIGTASREGGRDLASCSTACASEEVGAALNQEGIAVRSGHHCAQPILRRFGFEATVRPSLAFYNTCDEIDALVAALHRIQGNNGNVGH